jgi:hypothetical protein
MRTRKTVAIGLPLVVAASLAAVVVAHDEPRIGHAHLSGFEETPSTLSSPGSGTLDVAISRDEDSLRYRLHYEGLVTPVQQAHIHLGRPATSGGIMVFFCTNLTPPTGVPAPQACPQGEGTVTGVLTEADIVGPAAQGISATSATRFSQLIEALRAESAYGNVHTMAFPGGEVRGQIHFDDKRFDGRGHDDKGHNGGGPGQ